ncbi:MAG TPA: SusF/SusE family outer membrane protein [Bacteroidales bacterium]|jgi:hypothetical protein|nr:SusF/SusE family outer membrane protein [Bacteroidales bacterium]
MKKIYGFTIFLISLLFMAGCQEDEKIVIQQPDSFVLNIPKYSSGVYDLKNAGLVEFSTNQPDYGFTAATRYSVQLSLTKNFAEFIDVPGSHDKVRFYVPAEDIALALVSLHKAEVQEDYPTDPHPLYVRLAATIADSRLAPVYSNVIELPRVLGYFALEPVQLPEEMYIIGNVAGNWDWNNATEMVPVYGTPGKFWYMQYLGQTDGNEGDNAQIKFNYAKAWNGNERGFGQVTFGDESVTLAAPSDEGGNIKIGNPGWYIVVVTTSLDGRDYKFKVDFFKPEAYIKGGAIGDKWDNLPEFMFEVPDLSLGADADFISPAFTTDGEIRANIQLPDQEWWHTEFLVFDGLFVPRGTGGDQDRIQGQAGQRLYINFTKRTGKIE